MAASLRPQILAVWQEQEEPAVYSICSTAAPRISLFLTRVATALSVYRHLLSYMTAYDYIYNTFKTSCAVARPEMIAPSIYPFHTGDNSDPAKWTNPCGRASESPYSVKAPVAVTGHGAP